MSKKGLKRLLFWHHASLKKEQKKRKMKKGF
jgi:hypothetical protein